MLFQNRGFRNLKLSDKNIPSRLINRLSRLIESDVQNRINQRKWRGVVGGRGCEIYCKMQKVKMERPVRHLLYISLYQSTVESTKHRNLGRRVGC